MNDIKKLRRSLLLFFVLPLLLSGQAVSKNIVILNGGAYSNPDDYVTLGTYNPDTGVNEIIATVFSQSVQGLHLDDGFAYVAAQDSLAKINLETGEVIAIVELAGVNKFAVYNELLIVSRQFPATTGFVQARHIEDLSLLTTFDEISDESWEITLAGDTAYVSVAGGWAATEGKIAVLDLNELSYVREIALGELAVGIGPSFVRNDYIYFVCKTPWGGTSGSIVSYNMQTTAYNLNQFDYAFGEAAGIIAGKLFLVMDGNIGTINLNAMEIENSELVTNPFFNLDITALVTDSISERLYVNYSYWVAPEGVGKIYDDSGIELGEYEIGISAEEVAVNYADVTGADFVEEHSPEPMIYPNPCKEYLNIAPIPVGSTIEVYDFAGNLKYSGRGYSSCSHTIDLAALPPGVYFLRASDARRDHTIKFIHQ